VAYRSDLDVKDRSGAIAAVVAIHAALLFALLHMSGRIDLSDPQRALQVFNVDALKPPPPPPPPPQSQQQKPKEKEGGSAPKNIKTAPYRPVGVSVGPDGALYVAETVKGKIWRISYGEGGN